MSSTGPTTHSDINDWQVDGIKDAIASLDRGEGIPHTAVKQWVESWGSKNERSPHAVQHERSEW